MKAASHKGVDYFDTEHLKSNLRSLALRGSSLTLITQGCNFIIGTFGTIILARLITPRDFGLVTMALTFSLLLQNFGTNGFIEVTVQSTKIDHVQISTLFWINVATNLFLSLIFVALAPVIAWFYAEPLLEGIILIMSIPIFLGGLSTQHQALLIRNMKFNRTSAYELGAVFIGISVSILLAYIGYGYWALVAKWVVSTLIITIGAWIMCDWRPGLPGMKTGVKPMLRFAFSTYGNFVINYFGRNVDKILIGRFLGSHLLGNYDRAYHLSLVLPTQLVTPLTNVAISSFSKLSSNSEKYRNRYLEMLSTIAFLSMPLSAILTLTGSDLILFLLGPRWSLAGNIVTIFGLSIGVMMLYLTNGWLHLSLGYPNRWLRWSMASLAVTVLFILVGIRLGPLGVAAGYTASIYILTLPALWYASRPILLPISSILSVVWKSYIAALAAGVLSTFVLYYYSLTSTLFMDFHVLSRIIVATSFCISIYLALTGILNRGFGPLLQASSLAHEMIPKRSAILRGSRDR